MLNADKNMEAAAGWAASEPMTEADLPSKSLEGIDALTVAVFLAFRRAGVLHNLTMQRRLACVGSHGEEALMLSLIAGESGMSQRELAERLGRTRPWITKMLKSLERGGAVERRRDPHDPRIMRVYLTREGVVREAEIASIWKRYQIQTIGSLSEEDRRDFERLLDQFAERILAVAADEVQST